MKRKQKNHQSRLRSRAGRHPSPARTTRTKGKRIIEGLFCGTDRGFGFLHVPGEEEDVFIPAPYVGDALDGDRVKAEIAVGATGTKGRILIVLERKRTSVFGVLMKEGREERRSSNDYTSRADAARAEREGWYVLPDGGKMPPMPVSIRRDYREGDKVEATFGKDGRSLFLVRNFGAADSYLSNYRAILAESGAEQEFSPEVLLEAEAAAAEAPRLTPDREDLRGEVILTMDSATAKDLDDAVSVKETEDGYQLSVHIADLSHYVKPGSLLDREAHKRGSSIYFGSQVIPMLPKALSNGACSLNAGEDKYALTASLSIGRDGKLHTCRVFRSLIRSSVRGVYAEINDLLEKRERSEYFGKYEKAWETIKVLFTLYEAMKRHSREEGALELETSESKITQDETLEPIACEREVRGIGERMIEEFMIAANHGVATLLKEKNIPCIYRLHAPPPEEKLSSFSLFLGAMKLAPTWREGDRPSSSALLRLLEKAEEAGVLTPVSRTMVRALAKAEYHEKAGSHFGLALPLYCHFTSPIRRLPDLLTHRFLTACLLDGEEARAYRSAAAAGAGAANEGEERAVTLERTMEALMKARYLSHHIGETFRGTVSSVVHHGIYVELPSGAEGFIPIGTLSEEPPFAKKSFAERPDRYHRRDPAAYGGGRESWAFDPLALTMVKGESRIRIGDSVSVTVSEVDLSRRTVYLTLA